MRLSDPLELEAQRAVSCQESSQDAESLSHLSSPQVAAFWTSVLSSVKWTLVTQIQDEALRNADVQK